MKISLIVAMASNRAIGLNNRMPWHLSSDLKRFKHLTMGHPIIMGRLTFEAIGKPLPGRTNIIVSRNPAYQQESCVVENSLDAAINHGCRLANEIFIIGGATLYETGLPLADRIHLTLINQDFEGDTFFPPFDPNDWLETDRQDISDDAQAGFPYSFIDLQRL
jgi:dihydrofolate reductase